MAPSDVIALCRDLFLSALVVAAPALAAALVVGVLVSVLQTITSVQDQTLGHVPRLLAVGIVIVLTLGFTLQVAVAFAQRMFLHAARGGS